MNEAERTIVNEIWTQLWERYYQVAGSEGLARWLLPRPLAETTRPLAETTRPLAETTRPLAETTRPTSVDVSGASPPAGREVSALKKRPSLEIVSHCWRYAHLLNYQLSSLVLHPPRELDVRVTVFYSPDDAATAGVLEFFGRHRIPGIDWNWWPQPKESLFRRAIGRNLAARRTTADWIWFTDCDQVFHRGCLDALRPIFERGGGPLLFPRMVHCTPRLDDADPMLAGARDRPGIVDIDPTRFRSVEHHKAIGALQIVRGDVSRAIGYCDAVPFFQKPVRRWRKCYEDRVFRRLVGTQGEAIDLPGLFRIEHVHKGRKRQPMVRRRAA